MSEIDHRLAALGIEIPPFNPPQGNYLSYTRTGSLVFVAGQGPRREGKLIYTGVVGQSLSVEDGEKAARLCALNIPGQLRHACGGGSGITGTSRSRLARQNGSRVGRRRSPEHYLHQ